MEFLGRSMRAWSVGLGWAFVAGAAAAQETPPAAAAPAGPRYRSAAEVAEVLAELVRGAPEQLALLDFGPWREAGLTGLQIAAPGPVPAAERPTLLVIGALDGRSLAGVEAALATARALALESAALAPDVGIVCLPAAAPEALDRYLAQGRGDGGDARPVDDDRDGRADEDGPDDVDGDGVVLSMLIEDPLGAWVRSDDERFLVPAGPDDAPRFRLCAEGQDDDGDGRFNEDGPGGLVVDRNFPLQRPSGGADSKLGPLPLSSKAARALADFVLARRVYAVVLLQGNHGSLAAPGGVAETERWSAPDRALYEQCLRDFRAATARAQERPLALREARGADCGGQAQDWFAAVGGVLALEIAPWGPNVAEPARPGPRDARFPTAGVAAGRRPPAAADRAWLSWLDNVTGGSAFVGWHPATLAGGVRAWVGGWKPWTVENPPVEELPRALAGLDSFVAGLAAGAPRLDLEVRAERDGRIVKLRARVRNVGRLPTALAARSAVRNEAGLTLALELQPGQSLLAGREREEGPRLVGGELSAEREWVVLVPDGERLSVRASAPWCVPVHEELSP